MKGTVLVRYPVKSYFFPFFPKIVLSVVLCVLFVGSAPSGFSALPQEAGTNSNQTEFESGRPQEKKSSEKTTSWFGDNPAQRFEHLFSIKKFKEHLLELRQSFNRLDEQKKIVWRNIEGEGDANVAGKAIVLFLIALLVGVCAEKVVGWKLNKVKNNITSQQSSEWQESLSFLLLRLLCSIVGLAVFALFSMVIVHTVYERYPPAQALAHALITIILQVRLVSVAADAVLAPRASGIRLLNLNSEQAFKLYYWAIAFALIYGIFLQLIQVLRQFELEVAMLVLLRICVAVILNILIAAFLFSHKTIINQLFLREKDEPSRLREFVFQIWPTLALLTIFFLTVLFSFHVLIGNSYLARQLVITWWILIAFPLVDRLVFALLLQLKKVPLLKSRTVDHRLRRFISRILLGLRLLFLIVLAVQLCKALGLNVLAMFPAQIFEQIIAAVFKVAILFFLAYLCWEILQSSIERNLPEEPMDFTNLESDGGAMGATRAETLLPLARYFVAAVLVVVVLFSLLDILGVQIMPLIASAGVVGIAIGFGAQKLVQDVISGFFFLLDDAFRLGEYIEAAGMRGTVERISVRSMRLRHHRGAVQTIPFGEIATISNLSRDWITMKLEIRLPYDTDPERVRKIIKKVGEKMLAHEEYGDHFILPLKSQGVTRVEESALIFRVKFTSRPGEQWVLRRESYRLVKEALEKEGIYFAHRAVHVLTEDPELSPLAGEKAPGKAVSQAVSSAAAMAGALNKHDRIDDDEP